MKRTLAIICVVVGVGICLYPEISNYLVERNQKEVIKKYKENVVCMEENTRNLEAEKANLYNKKIEGEFLSVANQEANFYDYRQILNLFENGVMSYIEIPNIQVYLPIYHGTEEEIMKKGVGHIPNSSLPIGGDGTHCILTGHTGLLRAKIFTRLNELEVGDYFYLYTLEEKLSYQVNQIKVVLPNELDDLQIVEKKDLVTLVTCTPYGINTHRLLVQGERRKEEESSNSSHEEDGKEKLKVEENRKETEYYLIGILYGLILFFILVLCCILFHFIVKYIRKMKK